MKIAEVKELVKERLISIIEYSDIDDRLIGGIIGIMLQRDKEELINLLLFDKKILINQMKECVTILIDKQQNGHY